MMSNSKNSTKNQINKNTICNSIHGDSVIQRYTCDYCKKDFSSRQSKWRHLKTCENKSDIERKMDDLEKIVKPHLDNPKNTVQFWEQYLLYNYLAYYKTDIGFLYEYAPFPEHTSEYDVNLALAKKMIHMDFYFRQPKSDKLVDEIEQATKIII